MIKKNTKTPRSMIESKCEIKKKKKVIDIRFCLLKCMTL